MLRLAFKAIRAVWYAAVIVGYLVIFAICRPDRRPERPDA